jgi:hypothetical protein
MCSRRTVAGVASREQEFEAVEVPKVFAVIRGERSVEVYGGRRNPGIVW